MISKTMILFVTLFALFALAAAQEAVVAPVEPIDVDCFDEAGPACEVMGKSNSCGEWIKEASTVCRKTCGMCGSPRVTA